MSNMSPESYKVFPVKENLASKLSNATVKNFKRFSVGIAKL